MLSADVVQLRKLLADIEAASQDTGNPSVRPSVVSACRTTLDIVLLNTTIFGTMEAKTLAHEVWRKAKELTPKGLARLASRMEKTGG